MDPIVLAAMTATLERVNARLDAIEARDATPPVITVPAPSADTEALRAENEALKARLLASHRGDRRGKVPGQVEDGPLAATGLDALATEAGNEGRSLALVTVVRSRGYIDRRSEKDGAKSVQPADLESDLRGLCNAAVEDGLIRDPADHLGSWA